MTAPRRKPGKLFAPSPGWVGVVFEVGLFAALVYWFVYGF